MTAGVVEGGVDVDVVVRPFTSHRLRRLVLKHRLTLGDTHFRTLITISHIYEAFCFKPCHELNEFLGFCGWTLDSFWREAAKGFFVENGRWGLYWKLGGAGGGVGLTKGVVFSSAQWQFAKEILWKFREVGFRSFLNIWCDRDLPIILMLKLQLHRRHGFSHHRSLLTRDTTISRLIHSHNKVW